MSNTLPLLQRQPGDVLAHAGGGPVTAAAFLGRVRALAEQLPAGAHAINLCRDRMAFLVAFCAVMLRSQTNLLPPNAGLGTQRLACRRFDDAYVLHDGAEVAPEIPGFRLPALAGVGSESSIPSLPAQQLAAISFTSGSTGRSTAIPKQWRTFFDSTAINRRHMYRGQELPVNLLATVPAQHMWGMETSVLMPLFADICIHPGQPLFPADVARALETMAEPRVLVSTPVHLQALVDSDLAFPQVVRVFSATAPLAPELAARVEECFRGEVLEIYGASEVGCMAWRRSAQEAEWRAFPELNFEAGEQGTRVTAPHLPAPVELPDLMRFQDDHRFTLLGRAADMINIAGKRGSLLELNQLLLGLPGIQDAVVFLRPDGERERLAALVVAPGLDEAELRKALAEHLDPVFFPRPLMKVDRLPRNATGKLPRDRVLALYRSLRAS